MAHGHRQVVDGLDAEPLEALQRADDVEDRVHRPNLVEVHVLRRQAVHTSLRLADQPEGAHSSLLHGVGHGRALDETDQLSDVAPVRMLGNGELHLLAVDTAAHRVAAHHADSREAEPPG